MATFLQLSFVTILSIFIFLLWKVLFCCWILPMKAYLKLKRTGFRGPIPNFPFGNINEMKKINKLASASSLNPLPSSTSNVSNDIHSTVFPYFAQWQKSYGKVFVYWLGTEPFLYIADPEFLKRMSSGVLGKNWGKPRVFKHDREPMFGNGLLMLEGHEWVHHRNIITPAFSPLNLKVMINLMGESTTNMLEKWSKLVKSGSPEIDVEKEITQTAGEIIGKTSFGMGYKDGREIFQKLRAMQITLFKSNRYVGVPFNNFLCPKLMLEARKLGKEIDCLLSSIIESRKKLKSEYPQNDLLGSLLEGNCVDGRQGKSLTIRELVDECKTFFFGGHETTALALTWTLMLLALHPEWQTQLRDEIKEVIGDNEIEFDLLGGLKKMGWVMNEVLRLYAPAPNVQRQVKQDMKVDNLTIPKGINIWIDVVAMNHDKSLWGDDVNQFKPERFKDDNIHGGCNHKMGFLPFGFGGRMCIGRNLSMMEYKIVLTLILTRFSFSLSPAYSHSPCIMLSLKPSYGLPLIFEPL